MSKFRSKIAALAMQEPGLRQHVLPILWKNCTAAVKLLEQGRMQRESGHGLDPRTLTQLVGVEAKGMELDPSKAKTTRTVTQASSKFIRALSKALSVWVQKFPPENEAPISAIMDADAGYNVFMTLDGAGVGIWDGRWKRFYKDTKKLESFLQRMLSRDYDALKTALGDAAWETAGVGEA